jgi:hypothetical protein
VDDIRPSTRVDERTIRGSFSPAVDLGRLAAVRDAFELREHAELGEVGLAVSGRLQSK